MDERLERATIAAYVKCVEQAPKWNTREEMPRFKPWPELDEDWRSDWRECIRAALEAADGWRHKI